MIVGSFTPVGGSFAFILQYGFHGSSLNIRWNFHSGKVKESRSEVHIHTDCVTCAAGFNGFGVTDDERHTLAFLIHEAFIEPTVLAEEESLVGSVDNDCIIQLANLFKIVQKAADIFVYRQYGSQIVAHILLILPAD